MSKYDNVHLWMNNTYTKTGICEQCGMSATTQWSNKSGEYRQERDDWQELCVKCHRQYDKQPHMRGASHKAGFTEGIVLRLRDADIPRAKEVRRILNLYKSLHRLSSQFDALDEIVKKEAAKLKLPK
jgi:hypothetical protein